MTEPFVTSHPKLLDNDKSALSLNAGTAFPTVGVMDGMQCYRTDEQIIYIRKSGKWVILLNLNDTTTNYGSSRTRSTSKPTYGLT